MHDNITSASVATSPIMTVLFIRCLLSLDCILVSAEKPSVPLYQSRFILENTWQAASVLNVVTLIHLLIFVDLLHDCLDLLLRIHKTTIIIRLSILISSACNFRSVNSPVTSVQ
jgi:hypothetical protein